MGAPKGSHKVFLVALVVDLPLQVQQILAVLVIVHLEVPRKVIAAVMQKRHRHTTVLAAVEVLVRRVIAERRQVVEEAVAQGYQMTLQVRP